MSGVCMQVCSHPVICSMVGVAESKLCYYTPRWWQPPLPCFNVDHISSFSSSFSNRSIEIVVCAWCEGLLASIIEMTVWKGIQQLSPSNFHVLLPDMKRALHCLEWEHLYSVESAGVGWCPWGHFVSQHDWLNCFSVLLQQNVSMEEKSLRKASGF